MAEGINQLGFRAVECVLSQMRVEVSGFRVGDERAVPHLPLRSRQISVEGFSVHLLCQ